MKQLLKYKSILAVLIIFLFVSSCVEDFDPNYNLDQSILVVEASITDLEEQQYVRLRESIPSGYQDSYFLSVKQAKVEVIMDGTTTIPFEEKEMGFYYPVKPFKGESGHTYQLKFSLTNGKKYQSSPQLLKKVSQIKKIYQQFTEDKIVINKKNFPGHYIYLDTEDPAGFGDYYYWTWKLYEKQNICQSCEGGMYYTTPLPLGTCRTNANLQRSGTIYDYFCQKDCYDIFYSDQILIQSDVLSDGLTMQAKEIARLPLYNEKGGLMIVKQHALNQEAYEYFKLLRDQAQNTGSFADTPPAALIGNIKNLDDINEGVGGFFVVAGISVKQFWVDRSEVIQKNLLPYGLLKGRRVNPEPMGSDITRPPLAPCVENDFRTLTMPDGFKIELFR